MPSFTRESGGTLHVAVMGVNRIGKECSIPHYRAASMTRLEIASGPNLVAVPAWHATVCFNRALCTAGYADAVLCCTSQAGHRFAVAFADGFEASARQS